MKIGAISSKGEIGLFVCDVLALSGRGARGGEDGKRNHFTNEIFSDRYIFQKRRI